MIRYCENCGHWFLKPDKRVTTYESYYGVSDLFPDSNKLTLYVCPNCGDEEITDCDEEELIDLLNTREVKL